MSISNLILIITLEKESGFIRVRRIRIFLLVGVLFWGFASLAQVQFTDRYSELLPAGVSYGTIDNSFGGPGISFADFDNDGLDDITIPASNTRDFQFLRNTGGQFQSENLPISSSGSRARQAIWVDYDNDGDLDLFVTQYVRWSREIDLEVDFRLTGIGRAYGPPTAFRGTQCRLFRNQGDGRFADVSAEVGVLVENPATGEPVAKALGVAPADIDGDGWIDSLVSNDTVQNFLFHNRGDGRFEELGTLAGIAFDRNGAATGAI